MKTKMKTKIENKMKKNIDKLLIKLRACQEVRVWAKGKTFEEIYTTCHRGDWLCWLFANTNPEDVQIITLVKGHQANTVRHLMTDERSREAVDTAIAFGEGRATEEELNNAADAAWAASFAADTEAYSATDAAWAAAARAARAARAAARAARAACAADAGSYAARAADAEEANQKLTADIFRKYISIEKFKI